MRLRSTLINLALTIGSLAIFLVILEGTTRFVWTYERIGSCGESDPILMHRNKPSCEYYLKKPEGDRVLYQINACGFRGEGTCKPRTPDIYRVFGIGSERDS